MTKNPSRSSVFWIPGPWPGRLGIVPRPRGGDWLEDEAASWRRNGIDIVVSLLEPSEVREFNLESEAEAVASNGLTFLSLAIPDRGVPGSLESALALAHQLLDAMQEGRTAVVHCRQSVGRSAVIAAAVLTLEGEAPANALKSIEMARGVPVPETEEQRRWIFNFAA